MKPELAAHKKAQAVEWFGVFLPARASAEAVNRLHAAVRDALGAKALQEALTKASFEVGAGESAREFTRQLHSDWSRWAEVVKASGFTPED